MASLFSRHEQEDTLSMLLGNGSMWTTPFIFLYGQHACGKSEVLMRVLNKNKISHVIVNCVECYTNTLLYQQLLAPFTETRSRCENVNELVRSLKAVASDHVTCIVLDKAESLRHHASLPALLRLQELTSCNVCVVLISDLPWHKYNVAELHPATLHFPDYTKDELCEILCDLRPRGEDVELYRDYVTMLLGVFCAACRDVRELKHVADAHFRFYSSFIEEGSVDRHDRRRLWRVIEPRFHVSLQQLYMRGSPGDSSPPDLSFYSKFLLIAAYIASYNPAPTDRRFFVKRAGKLRSSTKRWVRKNYHLHGPRPFALDRMMAIFYSIVDGRVPPTATLFVQISSLVELRLLGRVSHVDQIDSPRYKCLAPLSLITALARTVEFDVISYLFDFLR